MLYGIVRDHFETFRQQAASLREGEGLPRFVEQAFRDYLRCGWLAGGFARFRCAECGLDRLVAFSCKGRALCPSCGGRRMADRAAHLVDRVFPDAPIRQWVLTFPCRLRYRLAWHHDQCRTAAGLLLQAIFRILRARAEEAGVEDGRGGGVVMIQRFGGALNLNVHLHALVLDGVYATDRQGRPVFQPLVRLTTMDVEEVLAAVEARLARRLGGLRGDVDAGDSAAIDTWVEEAPVLAGLAAASVQNVAALGPRRGAHPRRLGVPQEPEDGGSPAWCHARSPGFSLHAALVIPAGQRARLERVCRYTLRPPVSRERLTLTADGQVRLALKRPWHDGTTDLVFTPLELLERLAVLVPRPRVNLLLYYGVLGARSAWRAAVVPREDAGRAPDASEADAADARDPTSRARGRRWAALMQRTFGFDVLACPRCGGRLHLVAVIDRSAVIERILRHLRLPTEIPAPQPARAPPELAWVRSGGAEDDEAC